MIDLTPAGGVPVAERLRLIDEVQAWYFRAHRARARRAAYRKDDR